MTPRLIEMLAKYVSIRADAGERNRVLTGELMKAFKPDKMAVIRASLRSAGGLIHDCSPGGEWPEDALPSWAERLRSPDETAGDALAEFTAARLAREPSGITVTLREATANRELRRRYDQTWEGHPFQAAGVTFTDYFGGAFVSRSTGIVTAFAFYRDGPAFDDRDVEQLRCLVSWMSHFDQQRILGPLDDFPPLPPHLRPLLKSLLSTASDRVLAEKCGLDISRQGFRKRADEVLRHYKVHNRNALKALFLENLGRTNGA